MSLQSLAMSSSARRLTSTKRGLSSRSSGGYPVTASSGNATTSALALRASLIQALIIRTLPVISPTVGLIWAIAIRRVRIGVFSRGSYKKNPPDLPTRGGTPEDIVILPVSTHDGNSFVPKICGGLIAISLLLCQRIRGAALVSTQCDGRKLPQVFANHLPDGFQRNGQTRGIARK